jgi:hypothetical protein
MKIKQFNDDMNYEEAFDKYANPKTWAREKITLVCTTNNRDTTLLNKMLNSAQGFDEEIIHFDEGSILHKNEYKDAGCLDYVGVHLTIPQAYNILIEKFVQTEWVCCFCDDDYFYPEGLSKMIAEIHKGIDADVAHFKINVSGYLPKDDIRGQFLKFLGKKEYELSEKLFITPKLLLKHGRMPAGSFFRKSAWEKVGGFQGTKEHDRNLWLRMAEAGCTFKYFDYLVYNYVRRNNSAWIKQKNEST